MTLDEAIKHCEEKAKELREQPFKEKMDIEDIADCEECAEEHEQLAEWLKELKAYKEAPKGDLISREALLKAMEEERQYLLARGQTGAEHIIVHHCLPIIDNAPTVEPDMEFAKWVTEMIFGNNEVEDFDFELFSELACRKLEKLGLVKQTESEWIKK